jgi:hypothetical protein
MRKQIEQVVDRFESLSKEKKEKVKVILKKYVNGEIEINEAYKYFVEERLILSSRFKPEDFTAINDKELKNYIKNKIPNISK